MNPTEEYVKYRIKQIADNFNNAILDTATCVFTEHLVKTNFVKNFTWMGRPIIQYPTDMFMIAELLWRVRPDFVIETGMAHGGSAVFYATILDAIGNGHVISIEKDPWDYNLEMIEKSPMRHRINVFKGSSVNETLFNKRVLPRVNGRSVFVVLDSNHTHDHVLAELKLYAPLVPRDSYIVVMDTAIEFYGHLDKNQDRPWGKGNNPWTAVKAFMAGDNHGFIYDKEVEMQALLTAAPDGWLRRL